VTAGVVEVLALEQDARPADLLGQPRGIGQRAGPTRVGRGEPVEFGQEIRVDAGLAVALRDRPPKEPK